MNKVLMWVQKAVLTGLILALCGVGFGMVAGAETSADAAAPTFNVDSEQTAALWSQLAGKTLASYGSALDAGFTTFGAENTVYFTNIDESDGRATLIRTGTVDSMLALHDHVISLHIVGIAESFREVIPDAGSGRTPVDPFGYWVDYTETTLNVLLPGGDESELDGYQVAMEWGSDESRGHIEENAYYILNLYYDAPGSPAYYQSWRLAREDWYERTFFEGEYYDGHPFAWDPVKPEFLTAAEALAPIAEAGPAAAIDGEDNAEPGWEDAPAQAAATDSQPEYARAYAEVLRAYETMIRAYGQAPEGRAVLLTDVTRDGAPELVFLYSDAPQGDSTLAFYTFADGQAIPLYARGWECAGADVSCFYQNPGTGDLCAIMKGSRDTCYHWYFQDGQPGEDQLWRLEDGEGGVSYSAAVRQPDGSEGSMALDQAQYESTLLRFLENQGDIAMYSVLRDSEGNVVMDGRNYYDLESLPTVAMTWDEALAILSGPGGEAPVEAAIDGETARIPEAIANHEMLVFYDPRYAETFVIRSDDTYWNRAEGEEIYLGRIDAVRQVSANVYALRVGEKDEANAERGPWFAAYLHPGEEMLVVLPNADPSELTGNIAPTISQDYNSLGAEYVPGCYYIGTTNESGELWFHPME